MGAVAAYGSPAFAPPKSEPGTTWELPDAIAREFCRMLVPSSGQSAMPRPDDARRARLTATVESVEDGVAQIRLTGDWEAVHLIEGDSNRPIAGTAVADAVATYDVRQQQVQSLLLTFRGTHGRPNDTPAKTQPARWWNGARRNNGPIKAIRETMPTRVVTVPFAGCRGKVVGPPVATKLTRREQAGATDVDVMRDSSCRLDSGRVQRLVGRHFAVEVDLMSDNDLPMQTGLVKLPRGLYLTG